MVMQPMTFITWAGKTEVSPMFIEIDPVETIKIALINYNHVTRLVQVYLRP